MLLAISAKRIHCNKIGAEVKWQQENYCEKQGHSIQNRYDVDPSKSCSLETLQYTLEHKIGYRMIYAIHIINFLN